MLSQELSYHPQNRTCFKVSRRPLELAVSAPLTRFAKPTFRLSPTYHLIMYRRQLGMHLASMPGQVPGVGDSLETLRTMHEEIAFLNSGTQSQNIRTAGKLLEVRTMEKRSRIWFSQTFRRYCRSAPRRARPMSRSCIRIHMGWRVGRLCSRDSIVR